jgi:hypothetical protein
MSCQGTYFGGCCEQSGLRNELVISEVSQTGFIEFDLRNRQQLYAYSETFVVWNFTHDGTTYVGDRVWTGFFDPDATTPRYTESGTPVPTISFVRFGLRNINVTPTEITASLTLTDAFFRVFDVGSYLARIESPLPLAEDLALQNALAYVPSTGANPGGCRIEPLGFPPGGSSNAFFGNNAFLYRGTFAPFPNAFPPRDDYTGIDPFDINRAGGDGWEGLTAVAHRILAAPSAPNLLRLRPWTFRDRDRNFQGTWPNPANFTYCQTIDLANGADVVVSSVPDDGQTGKDRIIFAGLDLATFPKLGPSPC